MFPSLYGNGFCAFLNFGYTRKNSTQPSGMPEDNKVKRDYSEWCLRGGMRRRTPGPLCWVSGLIRMPGMDE